MCSKLDNILLFTSTVGIIIESNRPVIDAIVNFISAISIIIPTPIAFFASVIVNLNSN